MSLISCSSWWSAMRSLCAELQRETGLAMPSHAAAHAEVSRAVEGGLGAFDLFAVERIYDKKR